MLSVSEREFVVVVSCFKFVLCHSNVSLCVPGCCCDCGFVDHVTCKTRTIERAKAQQQPVGGGGGGGVGLLYIRSVSLVYLYLAVLHCFS